MRCFCFLFLIFWKIDKQSSASKIAVDKAELLTFKLIFSYVIIGNLFFTAACRNAEIDF